MSRLAYSCVLLLLASIGISSCRCNPEYCEGALDNDCDNLTDTPKLCMSNDDCSEPMGICDLAGTMTCVQCTPDQAGACNGATPACGEDRTCRACRAHAECPASEACLPDGSCADPGQVAYVQPGGTGAQPCTRGAPCGTLQEGVTAVNATRPYIKVMGPGTVTDGVATTIDGKTVTIVADPGAKLDRTGDGPILVVRSNNTNVSIYDLEITGQTGLADAAVQLEPNGGVPTLSLVRAKITGNQGLGLSASGGTLTVSQSTLSGNTGGGISASGAALTFTIVGNVFFANGAQTGSVGGVSISTSQGAMNRLEFNSFQGNQTQLGVGAAIQCVAGTFTARNNIMSENGTLTNMAQTGGTCMHTHSIVRPGVVPSGAGNLGMDPLFVNTMTGDLHVRAGSPALSAADPNSDLTGPAERDIDGDARTPRADIGADEVP